MTDKALHLFDDQCDAIADKYERFDRRTEQHIMTLVPAAQEKARQFMSKVIEEDFNGVVVKIISGTRTYAEQAEIFAQGRTKAGNIVTNAGPGHSNHNFGIAWDVGIFQNGEYLQASPIYKKVGAIGKKTGLQWGGDWKSFVDQPHYQLPVEFELAELRNKFENGHAYA